MDENELNARIARLEDRVSSLSAARKRRWWRIVCFMLVPMFLTAGTVTKPYTFSSGQSISSAQVNSDFNTLYSLVNGNIGSTNLSSDAGSLTKVSAGLITASGGNIGIGTASPAANLDVAGTVRMTGLSLSTNPSNGYVLTSDSNGTGTWQALPASPKGFSDGQQTISASSGWFSGLSYQTISQITVTVAPGQRVLIMCSGVCSSNNGGGTLDFYLNPAWSGIPDPYVYCQASAQAYPFAFQWLDAGRSGSVTYTLQARDATSGDAGTIHSCVLTAIVG